MIRFNVVQIPILKMITTQHLSLPVYIYNSDFIENNKLYERFIKTKHVRFEILNAVKMTVLWAVTPYRPLVFKTVRVQ
jgi:hypothetical protein